MTSVAYHFSSGFARWHLRVSASDAISKWSGGKIQVAIFFMVMERFSRLSHKLQQDIKGYWRAVDRARKVEMTSVIMYENKYFVVIQDQVTFIEPLSSKAYPVHQIVKLLNYLS